MKQAANSAKGLAAAAPAEVVAPAQPSTDFVSV